MKRKKGGKLREREGRSLSSYARNEKAPFQYSQEAKVVQSTDHGFWEDWRRPRHTQEFITRPFTRRS